MKEITLPPNPDVLYIDNMHMTRRELECICKVLSSTRGNAVEIGCHLGKTTLGMAVFCKDKTIYAVDYPESHKTMMAEQRFDFPGNAVCEHAKNLPNVHLVLANSFDIDYHALDDIGFIFIDGDHSYNGVKKDSEKAIQYIFERGDGVIMWHDYRFPEDRPHLRVTEYVDKELDNNYDMEYILGTRIAMLKISK